jgi:dTDP-4-amino-4,6-dideoxygalactose transaminase
MRKDFLVFGQPLIEEAEIAEVVNSLQAAWLGTGPKVAEFEELVREYKGVRHAIAVNSCTAGLHLSCLALELQPGDEVITTPLTFCANGELDYQKRYGWRPEQWPNAERVGQQIVSLPLSPKLTDADVDDVIGSVRKAFGHRKHNRTSYALPAAV